MADYYKGLTIRIGADTKPFTQALTALNGAISSVQSSLRLIQKGLKFDPSNLALTKQNVQLVGEKTELLATKFLNFRHELEQVGQSSPSLMRLASSTGNLAARGETALSVYNKIDAELEKFKTHYNTLAKKNDVFKKDDFRGTLDGLKKLGLIQDDVIENYNQMAATHDRWQSQLENIEKAQALRRVKIEMEELKSETKASAQEFANLFGKMAYENITGIDGKKIASSRAELQKLDNIERELVQHAEELAAAYELDPSKIQLSKAAQDAFNEALTVSEAKLAEAKRELHELNEAGIESTTMSAQEFANALDRANQKLTIAATREAKVAAEAEDLKKQIKEWYASTDKNKDPMDLLNMQVRLGKVRQLLNRMRDRVKAASTEYEKLQQQGRKRDVEKSVQRQTANLAKMKSRVDQVNASLQRTRAKLAALRDLGTTLANTVSPLATAALYRTITAADDLDSAYRDMRKTVDGTEEQFEHLKKAAIEFSQTSVVSASDILEIEAMAGQLGIAVSNLETFAEVASNLDIATDIESEEIAKSMGQLSNIMHWHEDTVDGVRSDYEKFSDALVRLGNNFPTQESAIMNITNRIAPMGTLLDMTTDQVLAWSTALASTGQGPEAAGTALAKTMSQIESATAEGGDSLKAFADIAGMSSKDFKELWDKDASAGLLEFVEGLKRIDDSGGSVDATLQGLKITGVRQKQALEGLVNTYDVLEDALRESRSAWLLGGDAAEEARKKSEGFSGTYHILLNNGKALASVIGDGLVPFMKTGSEVTSTLATALGNLGVAGKTTVAALLGLAAASGPVFRLWGQSQLFFDARASNMERMGKSAGKLSRAWNQLGGAGKTFAGIAATAAIVLGTILINKIAELRKEFKTTKKALEGTTKAFAELKKSPVEFGKGMIDMSKKLKKADFTKTIEGFAALADKITDSYKEVSSQKGLLEEYRKTISKVGNDGSIAAEDVADMQRAVDGLNAMLGTSYEISGNASKGYQLIGGSAADARAEINKLISAMETQQLWSMYSDWIDEANKTIATSSDPMEKAWAEYEKYNDLYQQALLTGDDKAAGLFGEMASEAYGEWNALNGSVKEAETNIADAKTEMEKLYPYLEGDGTALELFIANTEALRHNLPAGGDSVKNFAKAFSGLGGTQKQLEGIQGVWAEVAELYANNPADLAAIFKDGRVRSEDEIEKIIKATRKLGGQGAKFVANFYDGIAAASKAKSKDAIQHVETSITNGFAGIQYKMQAIGADVIDGLIKGMQEKATAAVNAAKNIAGSVATATANALKVNSPSKVMIPIGESIPEGLAVGIEESASLAYRAAQDAAALAVAGFGALTAGEMAVNANNAASMVLNISFNGVTINDNAAIESQTLDLVMALQQLYRTKVGA